MSSPEPLPLRLSPKARQDFVDILRYTGERWGQQQLLVYRRKLDDALQAIRRHPELGQLRTDLPSTHRALLVGAHILIYRIEVDGLALVRILHQRMSISRHL